MNDKLTTLAVVLVRNGVFWAMEIYWQRHQPYMALRIVTFQIQITPTHAPPLCHYLNIPLAHYSLIWKEI